MIFILQNTPGCGKPVRVALYFVYEICTMSASTRRSIALDFTQSLRRSNLQFKNFTIENYQLRFNDNDINSP